MSVLTKAFVILLGLFVVIVTSRYLKTSIISMNFKSIFKIKETQIFSFLFEYLVSFIFILFPIGRFTSVTVEVVIISGLSFLGLLAEQAPALTTNIHIYILAISFRQLIDDFGLYLIPSMPATTNIANPTIPNSPVAITTVTPRIISMIPKGLNLFLITNTSTIAATLPKTPTGIAVLM